MECSEGRVLGPLDPAKFPQIHTSHFGVIPKGSTGRWQLIVDMSSPEGGSVNDGIPEEFCSLSDKRCSAGHPVSRKGNNDGKGGCKKRLP